MYRYVFNKNFQVVTPGSVYRSAQPEPGDLRAWVAEHNIKTVLNLRGVNPGKNWFVAETEEAASLGLRHVSLRMNSVRLPPSHILKELVAHLRTLEKPMLVHCRGGVHRSGLAGSVALLLSGANLEIAKEQYSPTKGFFAWFDDSDVPSVLSQYELWLSGKAHTESKFTEWVMHHYIPYYYNAEITLSQPLSKVTQGQPIAVEVLVKNISNEIIGLTSGNGRGVRLGVRVFPRGAPHFIPGVNNWLSQSRETTTNKSLRPGSSIALTFMAPAITKVGKYDLVVDLVDEHVTWFEKMGSVALIIPVTVISGT